MVQLTARAATALEQLYAPMPFMSNESGAGYKLASLWWTCATAYLVSKMFSLVIPLKDSGGGPVIPVPDE